MGESLTKNPKLAELACSNGCFVTTLALMAVSKLGIECLEWEPEIVVEAFEAEFGIDKLPQKACDKLQAGLMLIGTNAFTASLEGFLSATKVMNNRVFDESEAPYCDLRMCSWSVYEYTQLMGGMGDEEAPEEFSPDIVTYIQEVGKVNGVTQFPEWLSFANSGTEMPDMTGDVDLFELYNARQQDYVALLTEDTNARQQELASQLNTLKEAGIIKKPA